MGARFTLVVQYCAAQSVAVSPSSFGSIGSFAPLPAVATEMSHAEAKTAIIVRRAAMVDCRVRPPPQFRVHTINPIVAVHRFKVFWFETLAGFCGAMYTAFYFVIF
jgi:hypothetical protein